MIPQQQETVCNKQQHRWIFKILHTIWLFSHEAQKENLTCDNRNRKVVAYGERMLENLPELATKKHSAVIEMFRI